MSLRILTLLSSFLCLPGVALEPPASIERARLEVRENVLPASALEQAARDKALSWVGWSVPAVPAVGDACCFTNSFKRRGCSLADRENSWGTSSDHVKSGPAELFVLVETKDGKPSRVKMRSE